MIPLLDAQEMQALETEAIAGWGISSIVLQEHAAMGALALLPAGAPLQVLAGPGNNGGDALALARLARLRGHTVEVWALEQKPKWTGDAGYQAALWEGLGGDYRFTEEPAKAVVSFSGWVVDGLFGLGVRLPLLGVAKDWAEALHGAWGQEAGRFQILALDLPSGLDPSRAEITGTPVRAHRTACFGHLKRCHGLLPAQLYCGEVTLIPIPLRATAQATVWRLEAPECLAAPDWNCHKRQVGHVAIRAGSRGMSGAAVLAALGALRMGAGLVTLLVEAELRAEIAAQVPEAMVRAWDGRIPEGVDALLVGPGGVEEIPSWEGPLVVDASALRPGEGARWMQRPATVITPHAGEFTRLFSLAQPLSTLTEERLGQAAAVATGPGILVLKGAQTVIAGGSLNQRWVNPTGHPGLATGGTGDFLSGMMVAKMANWARAGERSLLELRLAAATAVWLHGKAADRLGAGPVLVRELGSCLAALLREMHEN